MNNKTRDISPYDFLQALQKEFICLEIRSKIYTHKNDKEYFKSLMEKKEKAIRTLSRKNRIENILDMGPEYLRVWKEIVPQFGFPDLIYNIVNVSDKQLNFPYKGTAVEINDDPRALLYGVCERVIFERKQILVNIYGDKIIFPLNVIKRLDHKRTDEYFYYYPGNEFQCDLGVDYEVGILSSYDMNTKQAEINFKDCDKLITLHASKISRIL